MNDDAVNADAQNLTRNRRWLVVYDISDDRERRLIHELLKDYGRRVQYSVFECELSKRQQQALRVRLCQHIADGDSIRWYPLCRWCESRVVWMGKGQAPQFDNAFLIS